METVVGGHQLLEAVEILGVDMGEPGFGDFFVIHDSLLGVG
jgi:hypothetical protein